VWDCGFPKIPKKENKRVISRDITPKLKSHTKGLKFRIKKSYQGT
jgi:hypothetical protein